MIQLKNLAPDYRESGLFRRTDAPAVVLAGGWTPRTTFIFPDGQEALVASRDTVVALFLPGEYTVIADRCATLADAPTAVFALGNQIVAMTPTGRNIFNVDASGRLSAAADPSHIPSGIWLRAEASTPAAVTMPATELSKSYDGLRQLEPADKVRAARHAADLYDALDRAAKGAGTLCCPAVGAVRFCRADGTVAFTSAPVLLTLPEADVNELDRTLRLTARESKYIGEATVTAAAWRLRVHFPELDVPEIASAQVVLSPLMQPADNNPDRAVVSDLGMVDGAFCTVTFPQGTAADYGTDACAAVLAASVESAGRTVATIANPFAGYDGPVSVFTATSAAEDEAQLLATLTSASGASAKAAVAPLLPPHAFTATAKAESGGTVLWSGLQSIPFSGYDPETCVAATAGTAEPWRAYVAVTMADGSRLVRSVAGVGAVPVRFGPFFSYPSPQAVKMEIGIDGNGTYRKAEFALTPDVGGSLAAYTHPSGKPFSLPLATMYALPAARRAASAYGGIVAAAPAASPLAISAVATVKSSAAVAAILPSKFSTSAWDFGRSRFLLFTAAGFLSATVDKACSYIATGDIDPRTPPSAGGTVAVRTSLGVLALAGDDVVLVDGSKITTVACGVEADSLAFDPLRHEVWCLRSGSAEVLVLCPRKGWLEYRRSLPAAVAAGACGRWINTSAGICDMAQGAGTAILDVRCVREISPGGSRRKQAAGVRCLDIDLRGSVGAEGKPFTATLSRAYLGLEKGLVARLRLKGTFRAPLRLPVMTPAAVSLPGAAGADASYLLALSGPAGADFTIYIPEYSKP